MRIVLKNTALVFATAKWTAQGTVIKVMADEVEKVSLPSNAKVYSRNLVDASQAVFRTILNDNGEEVADGSSYFKNFIPVKGGCTLSTNYTFARIYLYDKDFNLLERYYKQAATVNVPATSKNTPVVWARIQTAASVTESLLPNMIVVRDEPSAPTTFEPFQSNADGNIYSPYSWVWADDLSEINIAEAR